MRIRVHLKDSVQNLSLRKGSTVADAARKVGIYPDAAVFIINKKIVPSDYTLQDNIDLFVLPAASGG